MAQQREPTGDTYTQENIDQVLGVYEQSQGVMGQVLQESREMKQLQKDNHLELGTLNTNMGALAGVMQDIRTTLSRTFPPTPPCVAGTSGQSTSVQATGRAVLPLEVPPAGTPDPAAANPTLIRRRGHPPKHPGGADGKTPTNSKKRRP